jgi:hypothetical protein
VGELVAGPWAIADELGRTAAWARSVESFSFIPSISQYSKTFQFVKYDMGTSRGTKISKLCTGVDLIVVDNFSHWPNFRFLLDFNYKFQNKI